MSEREERIIFSQNLNKYLDITQKSQKEVADAIGVSPQTFNTWCKGIALPRMGKVQSLADYFGIMKSDLIEATPQPKPKGIRINVYGSVPAGIPIEAIKDIIDWEEIPEEWTRGGQEYIALKVIGDSMYPKYMEGDTIIIQLQPTAESGQDCVVYVNGFDATLKTVKFLPEGIQLVPINPSYPPKTYGEGDDPVKILGIVVEIRRKP